MPSRAKDWFAQAERDLQHAQHSMAQGDFEWACFAAHQSSEKALKSVFQSKGGQVIGHSLTEMLVQLKSRVSVSARLADIARALDKFYIPTRYPDAHPAGAPFQYYTKKEADQAINYASKLVEFCRGLLAGS